MSERVEPMDDLSGWEFPPLSARDAETVRVFETAAEATAFLKTLREHIEGAQRARAVAA